MTAARSQPRVRARAPNVFRPWVCALLCVDPGEHCGAAVYGNGNYIDSWHGDGYDTAYLDRCIDNARFYAAQLDLPLVLVRERPPRGGAAFKGRSPAGAGSVLGCRKLWHRAWVRARCIDRLRVDVYPVTWRSQILGLTSGPMLERAELLRASHLAGKDIQSRDEAAAVLIGEWAAHAGAVGLVLGTRRVKRCS